MFRVNAMVMVHSIYLYNKYECIKDVWVVDRLVQEQGVLDSPYLHSILLLLLVLLVLSEFLGWEEGCGEA